MALFVYQTEECKEDSRNHSIEREINIFIDRILLTQRTTLFDNFPPPYLKKRFKRQLRLLCAERKSGDDVVIVFYRILVRGGSEYLNFLKAPKNYGDEKFAPLISDENIRNWVLQQKEENILPEKQGLKDDEYLFLYGLTGKKDTFSGEYFIYETYDWIKQVQDEEIQNRLIRIPNKITQIIDTEDDSGKVKLDSAYYIYFHLFKNEKVLCLYSISKQEKLESNIQTSNDIDVIYRISGKSYPSYLLIAEDLWIDIEKNKDTNIALSPEETMLLKSIHSGEEDSGFPLFINGRAGSGKSTILQFLYADYLRFYYDEKFDSFKPPIFLTYSKSLVDKCISNISALINYHYNNIEKEKKIDKKDISNNILSFREFLLDCVKTSENKQIFPIDKYVDFSEFKKLWYEHFANDPSALKLYGPDISWHIIRGFIKGVSLDDYLELEDYLELPHELRSVTKETYKLVFERVWENWYKPLSESLDGEGSYWDEQDLVRIILINDIAKPSYPAIFCDESQDFTRIELELLLRLNLFTERKINSLDLKRIPFVFAGDPFQTLNPTGFRWESIKATYVEKFINSLSPEMRFGNPKLNYKELTFNYRSSENIVKLSNSIQFLRKYLFNYQSVEPQFTWHIEENPTIPSFYYLEDPVNKQKVKEQTGLAIIVPCNNGEEKDFVENDEFLKNIIQIDETGVPQNIYSPMRAKGLEFNRVLLYCFSDYRPQNVDFSKIETIKINNYSNEEKIPLEYYINQLYVGVSRAQKRLFIIEKTNNFDKLWRFVTDTGYQDEIMTSSKVTDDWKKNIGSIIAGTTDGWDKETENLESIAQQLENEGKSKNDSYLLRQAALYFKNTNNEEKNKDCRAYAYQYEENFKKSGDLFVEIRNYQEALKAYWSGSHYKEIAQFFQFDDALEYTKKLEVRISILIIEIKENFKISDLESFFNRLKDYFDKNENISSIWEKAINKLIENVIAKKAFTTIKDFNKLYFMLIPFDNKIKLYSESLGEIAYQANLFKEAKLQYEQSGNIRSVKYKEANANYLLSLFNENSAAINNDDLNSLGDYFLEKGKLIDALNIFIKTNQSEKILFIINSLRTEDDDLIIKAVNGYLYSLSVNQKWLDMIGFFSQKNKLKQENRKRLFDDNKNEFLFFCTKEIATDVLLPSIDNKTKEKVSDFLKLQFINTSPSSWNKYFYPELIGCAIEKSGRDIDSLQFYEKVFNSNEFNAETKLRAKKRWITVKNRQSIREENSGIKDRAEKHRLEAKKELSTIGLDKLNEPEFPSIVGIFSQPIDPKENNIDLKVKEKQSRHIQIADKQSLPIQTEEKKSIVIPVDEEQSSNEETDGKHHKENLQFSIDNLQFDVIWKNDRINITQKDDGLQIALIKKNKLCNSTDIEFVKRDNVFVSEILNVEFIDNNIVKISLKKYDIDLIL